jgi:hypothetical protein
VSSQPIEPEHAYALAREAGVSYEAAVRQLAHLDVITPDRIAVLRQSRPLHVKAALALGRRPVSGYADVWPVNEDWDDELLALRVEDEVVISLPENRSTGYRWMLPTERRSVATSPPPPLPGARQLDQSAATDLRAKLKVSTTDPTARAPGVVLERLRAESGAAARELPSVGGADVVGDEYVPARTAWLPARQARRERIARHTRDAAGAVAASVSHDPLVAGTGRRVLSMRFPRPGPVTIRLQYQSPYSDDDPIEHYVLHALVESRRVGFSVDQLAMDTDEPWTAQVRRRNLERPLDPLDDEDELNSDAATDEPT